MNRNETIADIVAELRSITFAMKVHDAVMPEVYEKLCEVALRIEEAVERERAEWKERIRDGMEIAEAFKKELNHVLDILAFAKEKRQSKGRRQDEQA